MLDTMNGSTRLTLSYNALSDSTFLRTNAKVFWTEGSGGFLELSILSSEAAASSELGPGVLPRR